MKAFIRRLFQVIETLLIAPLMLIYYIAMATIDWAEDFADSLCEAYHND